MKRLQTSYVLAPPSRRPLKIFASDPMAGRMVGNRVTIDIPNEDHLAPGPSGERIEVVDFDGANSRPRSTGVRPARTSHTICCWNSSEYVCCFPIVDSWQHRQVSTKPGQLSTRKPEVPKASTSRQVTDMEAKGV